VISEAKSPTIGYYVFEGISSDAILSIPPFSEEAYAECTQYFADYTTDTKADIYSGSYDDVVQNCVEDLIVDEEALELAFEGSRFFDLMRVAHRRNDPNYLASRVARRDASLLGKLQNPDNWYFPLPAR